MRLLPLSLLAFPLLSACSDPVPNPYEGAWQVNLQAGSNQCALQGTMLHPQAFGNLANEQCTTLPSLPGFPVDDKHHCGLLMDGDSAARLFCVSRQQGGAFSIEAESRQGANYLSISVPAITSAATATSPAMGQVTFASGETVNVYSSDSCEFYFNTTQSPELAPGKFWVTFQCPQVEYTGVTPPSVCSIGLSYAAFQYCEE